MALDVSAGTETLHAASFSTVDATQSLIVGAQHHIYTVLSTFVYTVSIGTAGDTYKLQVVGHDHHAGQIGTSMILAKVVAVAGETFVWNDKFSFNGYGAAAYTEPLNTAVEQAAIAQQGGASQVYNIEPLDADVISHITVTFIDQNNA